MGSAMNRRKFLHLSALAGAHAALARRFIANEDVGAASSRHWHDSPIADLQAALESGTTSAVSLTEQFLRRINDIDRAGPALLSVIEVNPDADAIARSLDDERKTKGPRGPLHGVPVLVKDNLDTHDKMMTTAGSLALLGSVAPRDSFVVQRLRKAGAVLLGKTNLSEWANFRASPSTSGWSARGGLTKNPYALDRNPSGSSSGSAVAVAAGLCAVAVGTETNGSIISPSTVCGVVGLKPTVGLVSRAGIIPISASQDTAGPMARTIRDVAILLGAIAGPDERDPATAQAGEKGHRDYTQFLDAGGLKGARIGIPRQVFRTNARSKEVIDAAMTAIKDAGATVIDAVEMPGWGGLGGASYEVMLYEFKSGLDAYLATHGADVKVRTLGDLIEFNRRNADKEMPHFGQEIFLAAQAKGPLTDKPYLDALEKCRRCARAEGIDAAMDQHKLDALVAPSGGPAGKTDLVYGDRDVGGSSSPAAVAGYPNITVPAGTVRGLPVGISFFGRAWSEPTLLRLAYAFEQLTQARKAPEFLSTVG
jgi:amidase